MIHGQKYTKHATCFGPQRQTPFAFSFIFYNCITPDYDIFVSKHVACLNTALFGSKYPLVFEDFSFSWYFISGMAVAPHFVNLPCPSRHLVTAHYI